MAWSSARSVRPAPGATCRCWRQWGVDSERSPVAMSPSHPGLLRLAQLGLYLVNEASWLVAWSIALGLWLTNGPAGPLLSPPVIAGLLLAATLATRLLLA